MKTRLCLSFLFAVVTGLVPAIAQNAGGSQQAAPPPAAQTPPTPAPSRPTPPTRDPSTSGYVAAKELPDGAVPPSDADGNFIIGPTHTPAPEMTPADSVPKGAIYNFEMSSADSKMYPGIVRDAGTFGTPDPSDPPKLVVTINFAGSAGSGSPNVP